VEENKNSNGNVVGIVIAVILGVLTIASQFNDGGGSSGADSGKAEIIAKNYVELYLKNPDSAKFKNISSYESSSNTYEVRGVVNATNSFGGRIDTPFRIKIKYNGGDWANDNNWTVVSIDM